MKVIFVNRSLKFGGYSFEELFATIKNNLQKFTYQDYYDKTASSFFKDIKALKKIKTNIYHITGGLGYYALFLPTKKTILTVHDTNHYEFDLKGVKKWVFAQLFYKIPAKNVKYITVVSEHTKKRLIELFGFKASKIRVIPNCYPDDFIPYPKSNPTKTSKILQIGTKQNKNISRLIIAIKGLNIELTIVGKINAELKKELELNQINYINKHNLTHQEILNEYINCDIVAFASLHEGFGLPIIEANAIGRPVITSNISSMPEVAGNAAHLVNPLSIVDIKNGIEKIITNEKYYNQLVDNGFKNCKKYTSKVIVKKYEDLYLSILENN